MTYEIFLSEQRKKHQTFHVNLLREWKTRNIPSQQLLARVVAVDEEEVEEQYLPVSCKPCKLPDMSHLDLAKQKELENSFSEELFSERPGRTDLVAHDMQLLSPETAPIHQSSYCIQAALVPASRRWTICWTWGSLSLAQACGAVLWSWCQRKMPPI